METFPQKTLAFSAPLALQSITGHKAHVPPKSHIILVEG